MISPSLSCLLGNPEGPQPFPYHEGKHLLVAVELFTYSDESGIERDQLYCVLAGFAGNGRDWEMFEGGWQAILQAFGVAEFKAARYFARDSGGKRIGEYANWGDEYAAAYRDRLLETISRNNLQPIGCAVEHAAFDALTEGERRFLTGGRLRKSNPYRWARTGAPSKAYYFAMLAMIGGLLQELAEIDNIRLHFFFDDQSVLRDHAFRTYHDLIQDLRADQDPVMAAQAKKTGFIAFGDSENLPRLQAADLLAHGLHGELVGEANPERSLMFIRAARGHRFKVFDASEIDRTLAGVEARDHYRQMS